MWTSEPATSSAILGGLGAVQRASIEEVGVALGASLRPAARAPRRGRHALLGPESLLGGGVQERITAIGAHALLGAVQVARSG